MLNFDHSTVKHDTQNIQNDCHQWLSDSFRVHQIRFRPGIRPGPHWGSSQRSPITGLRGPTLMGGEERKETGGTAPPLSQIPGSAPVVCLYEVIFS